MTNLLSAGPFNAVFMSDVSKGRSSKHATCFLNDSGSLPVVYLGTSSNWSFSRRVLDGAHQAVHGVSLPPENFALDGEVYSLGWDGLRTFKDDDMVALPSFNHAMYLARSVQFHIGQVYHMFHEETFVSELRKFYSSTAERGDKSKLWYTHYLLVMAFGKALVSRGVEKAEPSRVELFVHGMKLIPDVSHIWHDPFTAAEIYCCAALYLQCVDFRYGAYVTVRLTRCSSFSHL